MSFSAEIVHTCHRPVTTPCTAMRALSAALPLCPGLRCASCCAIGPFQRALLLSHCLLCLHHTACMQRCAVLTRKHAMAHGHSEMPHCLSLQHCSHCAAAVACVLHGKQRQPQGSLFANQSAMMAARQMRHAAMAVPRSRESAPLPWHRFLEAPTLQWSVVSRCHRVALFWEMHARIPPGAMADGCQDMPCEQRPKCALCIL